MEVTDENGCTDSDIATVMITEVGGPLANAGGSYLDNAICGSPATIHLDGTGSTAGGTLIVSWEWSEATLGLLGSGETLAYNFDPGSYTVTLEVTDENGCTDSDIAGVEVIESAVLTGVTAEGGPIVLCVRHERDIGSEITITPQFGGVPGIQMTLAECVACVDCDCFMVITPTGEDYFSTSGPTSLTGVDEGSDSITITYTGPCGEVVESNPIEVIVEANEFWIEDNKDGIYGLDITTPGSTTVIEVAKNANLIISFGRSFCSDTSTLVDYQFDRGSCGGGPSGWIENVAPGDVSKGDIQLCNNSATILDIRLNGTDIYTFEIYRL